VEAVAVFDAEDRVSDLSLQEAAEKAGVKLDLLRKHIQRGKLRATKQDDDGRITVTEDDLDLYIAGEGLDKMSTAAHSVAGTTKTFRETTREIGNLWGQVPPHVTGAILEGLPTSKKQGSSEPFERATKNLPKSEPVDEFSDDPHFGRPVGYRHKSSPRWTHINQSTWELDGAKWSWNGMFWEGGGSAVGRTLGDGISPGAPAADRRPLAPSKEVKR
jgi:hypothetical protein